MQVTERKRADVEARADKMSDFLKMEYLESCLKQNMDVDIQKYCHEELSNLYEKKIMYTEAIKHIAGYRNLCVGNKEKIEAHLKETELFIKAELYYEANNSYKKAFEIASAPERFEIKRKLVEFYKKQIAYFEKTNRNAHLLKTYESLVFLVSDSERLEIKKRILGLYKKLGKIKESIKLEEELGKDCLNNATSFD